MNPVIPSKNASRYQAVILTSLTFLILLLNPNHIYAHPGNTASDGCHYCRTNCDRWGVRWNVRHCHGSGSSSTENPSGLTDSQEKEILDFLNSPQGRAKGDQMMKELIKPTPAPQLTTVDVKKTLDSPGGINFALILLALGGFGYGGYQWLKTRKNN